MSSEQVIYETKGPVSWVVLNRPKKLNAFGTELARKALDVVCRALADQATRVVVITGRGRAFSAGADLYEIAADPDPAGRIDIMATIAHKAIADDRYDDALAALDEMKPNPTLNSYERSLMWQGYGFVYSSRDEFAEAADSFEKSLSAGGLPEQAELQTRYNLAQLYVMLERYEHAITEFHGWFERVRNPSPTAYYMLAMAYLQKGDKVEALRNAERAVERSAVPKEAWLELLVALRLEQKEYREVVPVLENMVTRFPKKTYWLQLSAVYSELGEHEKALAVLELANEQGMLTKGSELMSLAQLYLYNQIPFKAARVLEEGIGNGVIEADARAWQLLALGCVLLVLFCFYQVAVHGMDFLRYLE